MLHILHEALQVHEDVPRLLLRHVHPAQNLWQLGIQAEQVDGAADQRGHGLLQLRASGEQPKPMRHVQKLLCRLVQRWGLI